MSSSCHRNAVRSRAPAVTLRDTVALRAVNVLCGLEIVNGDDSNAVALNDARKALLVGLALAADGLTNRDAWRCRDTSEYGGLHAPSQANLLSQERGRLARSTGIPIEYRRSTGRAYLGSAPAGDVVEVDARRFTAACVTARMAPDNDRLAAWREALAIWPRQQPLSTIHPYVRDDSVFGPIELQYRSALIAYGEAVAEDPHRLVDDIQRVRESSEQLLQELATSTPADHADARKLRHVLTQLAYVGPLPELDDATSAYLTQYRYACEYVYPQRLPRDQRAQDILVPLDDVYVSLSVGPQSAEEIVADQELADGHADTELNFTTDPELRTLDALLRTKRWAVVLGDPGSGKTTFLQWLALQHARALLAGKDRVLVDPSHLGSPGGPDIDLGPSRLPVFLSLSDYAQTTSVTASAVSGRVGPLLEFLARHRPLEQPLGLPVEVVESVIAKWLRAQRVIVLLDGIDEVADMDVVADVTQRIGEFCRAHVLDPREPAAFDPARARDTSGKLRPLRLSAPVTSGGNQLVATSRVGGYGRAPLRGPFTVLKLAELDSAGVERFARNWCHAVEAWQAKVVAAGGAGRSESDIQTRSDASSRALIAAVEQHSGLRRVAANPLMLTVLALVMREQGLLLPYRFAVLEQLVVVLVTRRSHGWTYSQVLDVLGPLALWMQSEGRRTAHRDEVERALRSALETRVVSHNIDRYVEEFLTSAKEQSGLLVETSLDYFGFYQHNVFRELLAAIELTRSPDEFPQWIADHLEDPHWSEVLLLGVGSIGQKHPLAIDATLLAILEGSNRAEEEDERLSSPDILHARVMRAASALLETDRGSPETIERIVTELVAAGVRRHMALHGELSRQLELTVAKLLDSDVRSRQVEPIVVLSLSAESNAPFLCAAIGRAAHASRELLAALDAVCRTPAFPRHAPETRGRLAAVLRRRGEPVDPVFLPIGETVPDVADRLAHLPAVADFIRKHAEWIDPPLSRFIRFLVTRKISERQALTRLLSLLREETGHGFDSLARLGRAIDGEQVHAWIEDQVRSSAIDTRSAARYFAIFPPSTLELAEMSADAVVALLGEDMAQNPSLSALAWSALEPASAHFDLAWKRLAEIATTYGYLSASRLALARIRVLLNDPRTRRHGDLLVAKLGLDKDPEQDLVAELRAMIEDPQDDLGAAAAVILAGRAQEPVSKRQVRRICSLLAEPDNPLRPVALRMLTLQRPEAMVGDAALAIARRGEQERRAVGDVAATEALAGLAGSLVHQDASRLVRWADREEIRQAGHIAPRYAPGALARIRQGCSEAATVAILDACLNGAEDWRPPEDFDLEIVRQVFETVPTPATRRLVAELFVVYASDLGRIRDVVDFATDIADRDRAAAATAIRAIAGKLGEPFDRGVAAKLASIADTLHFDDHPWVSAGARLAIDAARVSDPDAALAALSERTASRWEAARAVVYAAGGTHTWRRGDGLEARIASVAERLAADPGGIDALLSACLTPLRLAGDGEAWPERRAAVYLLAAVAKRFPALLIMRAPADFADLLFAACHDVNSYSVRRYAYQIATRYLTLNDKTIELIKNVTRDSSPVSLGISWQLRWRAADTTAQRELITAIAPLLADCNEGTILAAAVLMNHLGVNAPSNPQGLEVRREVRRALLNRALDEDPLLDIGNGRGVLSLRDTLIALLLETSDASASKKVPPEMHDPWRDAQIVVRPSDRLLEVIEKVAGLSLDPPAVTVFGPSSLSPEQTRLLNTAAYELLQMRIGARLSRAKRSEFLTEFELIMAEGSESDAKRFLAAARPDYRRFVTVERARLEEECREERVEIVALLHRLRPEDEVPTGDEADRATAVR